MTANTVTFRLRSAVRDMGKVLGFPLSLLDGATKNLPHAGVHHASEFKSELGEHLGPRCRTRRATRPVRGASRWL